MKTYFFCLVIFITLLASCSTVQVHSDYDRTIDFKKYKTYAWLQRSDSVNNYFYDNQIIEKNVKHYVNKEMEARGYKVDIQNPDLLLEYHSTSQNKTYTVSNPIYGNQTYNYNPAYNYNLNQQRNYYGNQRGYVANQRGYVQTRPYGYNNTPYIIGYNNQQVNYQEGTLLIDIIDRKINQMIWRGWSVDTLVDEETLEAELPGDVVKIFKRYPIPLPAPSKDEGKKSKDDLY